MSARGDDGVGTISIIICNNRNVCNMCYFCNIIYSHIFVGSGGKMESKTGRKEKIMIACVTFDTVLVTDPVEYYGADVIHLIHYVKDPEKYKGTVYQEFFDRVCEIIGSKKHIRIVKNNDVLLKDIIKDRKQDEIIIIDHHEKVFYFDDMLRCVLGILETSDPVNNDVFVNISAGTSEYTAAAAIASMMKPGTVPFTMNTKSFTVEDEKIRETYYKDDKPVGLTKETYETPHSVPYYRIDIPDKRLVRGLRVLYDLSEGGRRSIKAPTVIAILKEKGIWYRDIIAEKGDMRTESDIKRTEAVYYQRDFIYKWVDKGWIMKNEFKRYILSPDGENIINVFYTE